MIPGLTHIDDVTPERQETADGWNISTFRLPITGKNGASSAVFHGIFLPGAQHAVHQHQRADELCMYLRGRGFGGAGDDRITVRSDTARLMPRGVDHFFHNTAEGGPAEVFGIYVGAAGVAESGYVFRGMPTEEDLARCAEDRRDNLLYPLADLAGAPVTPNAETAGWSGTTYRELLSAGNGPGAFAFRAVLEPGGARARHVLAHAESYYLVRAGAGHAESDGVTVPLRPGHVWYVPAGHAVALRNSDPVQSLEIVGYHVGAATSAELGYQSLG